MPHDFLPQFRRRLLAWLQFRLESGRTPFRRVEETPEIMTGNGTAIPDLVLWINRDSCLAGAVIFIPPKAEPAALQREHEVARCLGLRQFVTWEARAVNIWATVPAEPVRLKSWPLPALDVVSADDFAIIFEQLLHELKNLAIDALLPPEELPAAYFANLIMQTLHDVAAPLAESARATAQSGQPDLSTQRLGRDKAWLTLWRLLAVLGDGRLPPGINPERFDRALGYAFAETAEESLRQFAPDEREPPLPEAVAVRFHHLAGRLVQLGWKQEPDRTRTALELILAAAARDCSMVRDSLAPPPGEHDLLVNQLPPLPLNGATVLAPVPCLAGLAVSAAATGRPLHARLVTELLALPVERRWHRIVANLADRHPLPAAVRSQRLTALRHPWPYRRFNFTADTPAWVWEGLHLAGLVEAEGQVQLTLPGDWAAAPGAGIFWQAIIERLPLVELELRPDGRQTLHLLGHECIIDTLTVRSADGSSRCLPQLDGEDLAAVAALAAGARPDPAAPRRKTGAGTAAEEIAATVFRDGVPSFPEHYLRRIDRPAMRTYRLPGPLQADSSFFDRVRLAGPDGSIVDSDNPVEAEALLLASRDGRPGVELPVDPAVTMQLIAAYRSDLERLWQALLEECRRRRQRQRTAIALARRLWRERHLPPVGED